PAARPRVQGAHDRRALSAARKLPHLGRVCRLLPDRLRGADAGHGGRRMSAPVRRFDPERILRVVLPLATLVLGVTAWHLVVKVYDLPPVKLPGPGLVWDTLIDDRQLLLESLGVTLLTTFEGFLLAA